MIFIDANYQEAAQYFALEEFLCTQKQFDEVFLCCGKPVQLY